MKHYRRNDSILVVSNNCLFFFTFQEAPKAVAMGSEVMLGFLAFTKLYFGRCWVFNKEGIVQDIQC